MLSTLKKIHAWLLDIDSQDLDALRRGRIFINVCAVMFSAVFVIVPMSFVHWGTPLFWIQLSNVAGMLLLIVTSAMLTRSGRVAVGAWVLSGGVIVVLTAGSLMAGDFKNGLWHYCLSVLLGGLAMRPKHIWLLVLAVFVAIGVVFLFVDVDLTTNPSKYPSFLILLLFVSLSTYMYSSVTHSSIDALTSANVELLQSNGALERARARAESANEAKSRMLTKVSHGLRTPLHTVIGYTELIDETLTFADEGLDIDELREDLAHVHRASVGLLLSIENLLAYSELDNGVTELELTELDAAALVGSLAHQKIEHARARGVSFGIEAPREPVMLRTDKEKLSCVLVNLLSNALKFTDVGGVTVRVMSEAERVVFEIEDSGDGIDEAAMRGLYSALDDDDRASTHARDGGGLGLVLSRRLALLLGGDLEITSEEGSGSIARLELPLDRGA